MYNESNSLLFKENKSKNANKTYEKCIHYTIKI